MAAGLGGQGEVEGGAFAEGAGGPDAAAVLGDDGAADGEAEAGAAHGAGVGGVDLLEALEDGFELVFGDAAALIADLDVALRWRRAARAEVDLAAGRGELDGVGDEVGEGLEDAVGIGPDVDALGVEGDADAGPWRLRGLLQAGGAAEEVVGGAHGECSSALPEPMRSSSRMSLTRRTRRSVLPMAMSSICCSFSGAVVEGAAGDEAERGAERGERRAQLVRDGGDELVLHAVEGAALGGVGEGDDDADGLAGVRRSPVGVRSAGGRRTRRGSWCRPCARRPRWRRGRCRGRRGCSGWGTRRRGRACRRRGCGG